MLSLKPTAKEEGQNSSRSKTFYFNKRRRATRRGYQGSLDVSDVTLVLNDEDKVISLPKGWLTRDCRWLPAVRAVAGRRSRSFQWDRRSACIYHMDGWAAEQQGGDGEPGTVNGGRSRVYHWDGWADIFSSRRRCSAEAKQQ